MSYTAAKKKLMRDSYAKLSKEQLIERIIELREQVTKRNQQIRFLSQS